MYKQLLGEAASPAYWGCDVLYVYQNQETPRYSRFVAYTSHGGRQYFSLALYEAILYLQTSKTDMFSGGSRNVVKGGPGLQCVQKMSQGVLK